MRRRLVRYLRRLLEIEDSSPRGIQYNAELDVYTVDGVNYEAYVFEIIKKAAIQGRSFQFRYDPVRNLIYMRETLLIGSDYALQVPELN